MRVFDSRMTRLTHTGPVRAPYGPLRGFFELEHVCVASPATSVFIRMRVFDIRMKKSSGWDNRTRPPSDIPTLKIFSRGCVGFYAILNVHLLFELFEGYLLRF